MAVFSVGSGITERRSFKRSHFFLRVISCTVNEKTAWERFDRRIKSVGELLNRVTGYTRPQIPKLFFECSRS